MNDKKMLQFGIFGTIIAALCCFTPVLAVSFGVLGLTAWLAKADYVLFPALVLFIGITAYGYYRHRRIESAARRRPQ